MREDVAKLWAEDLRQNADFQGEGALCSDGKFCCLGRLCELALNYIPGLEKRTIDAPLYGDGDFSYGKEDNFNDAVLPLAVRDWAGIKNCAGMFKAEGQYFTLIDLNDGTHEDDDVYIRKNFNEIADIIEKEWPNL